MPRTANPGTIRGLRQLTTTSGCVGAVAVDQRQALRGMLAAAGKPNHDDALRDFKRAVARMLGDIAPALLVDPELGLPAISADPDVPSRLPLIVGVEESGTLAFEGGKRSLPLAGWDAEAARRHGATAVKLLVYARPDHDPTLAHALALCESVRADCRRADIPFILEILPFRLDDETEQTYAAAHGGHVVAVARLGATLEPDLLKLAWPAPLGEEEPTAGALDALGNLGSPWALLSAGADHEQFTARVGRALREGGACGFIAGRALWRDAVSADGDERERLLRGGARERLLRLLDVVERSAGAVLPIPAASTDPGWFRQ